MHVSICNDGIVDYLRVVLTSENFIKTTGWQFCYM